MSVYNHGASNDSDNIDFDQSGFTTKDLWIVVLSILIGIGCIFVYMQNISTIGHPYEWPSTTRYYLNTKDTYYDQLRIAQQQTVDKQVAEDIGELLTTPIAQWLNTDADSSRQLIRENIRGSRPARAVPLFVVYNIPNRDLGGHARGGLTSAAEYKDWLNEISKEIGDNPSVVVLEPDALPGLTSIPVGTARNDRITLLRYALGRFLSKNTNTVVYLDAGNSKWLQSDTVVRLIKEVDPSGILVKGVSLNVSSYRSEAETRSYARAIADAIGYPLKFIIDTSRNGSSDTDRLSGWCNVNGARVGKNNGVFNYAEQYQDAFVKTPGESDGICGASQKPSGEFDQNLLFSLLSHR